MRGFPPVTGTRRRVPADRYSRVRESPDQEGWSALSSVSLRALPAGLPSSATGRTHSADSQTAAIQRPSGDQTGPEA
ncbi:hypothetical protein STAL104432_31595 [Streptomyces albus]